MTSFRESARFLWQIFLCPTKLLRLNQSGMLLTARGVNAIVALRLFHRPLRGPLGRPAGRPDHHFYVARAIQDRGLETSRRAPGSYFCRSNPPGCKVAVPLIW